MKKRIKQNKIVLNEDAIRRERRERKIRERDEKMSN